MIISAIVATAKKNVIGKNNQIPWYLPADLKYFKKTTLHHHLIMGRKCFESIGRPLPNRTNIIVTKNPFFVASNCLIAHSVEEALSLAKGKGEEEVFIIGGGEIYAQSKKYWTKIYRTEVELEVEGDVFFPKINGNDWVETFCEAHRANEKNEFDYIFKVFEKKLLE